MKMTIGVRVLGGSQVGCVAGILIAAGFYSIYWSPQERFNDIQLFQLMLNSVMPGALFGIVLGIWVAFQKKTLIASVGSFLFGVISMFTAAPIGHALTTEPTNTVFLPVIAVHMIVGAIIIPLIVPEWWKKKATLAKDITN
ncbi:MAG: hypothetical protein KF784_09255 [Fimbriimonadaceae bacterium]|nr:hypothetical protein [Fimbriimonadaceae bacterium]